MVENAGPKLLCIADGHSPSIDIAIRQPFDWLAEQGKAVYDVALAGNVSRSMIRRADAVLFARSADVLNLHWLGVASRLGKRILYYLDDNFFGLPSDTSIGRHYAHPAVVRVITAMLAAADLTLLGSPVLMDAMPVDPGRAVVLPFAYPCFIDPIAPGEGEGIVIGYFGTPGHRMDFAPLVPAIRNVLEAYKGKVALDICGFTSLSGMPPSCPVSFSPYEDDYRSFMHSLSRKKWDFCVAPLLDTPSNRCKTDVKYRDYSALGLPAVYSAVTPYKERVRHMETGVLAHNTEEAWDRALRLLIDDAAARRAIGANALADVRSHNSLELAGEFWMRDVFERLRRSPRRNSIPGRISWKSVALAYARTGVFRGKARLKKMMPPSWLRLYRRLRWRD